MKKLLFLCFGLFLMACNAPSGGNNNVGTPAAAGSNLEGFVLQDFSNGIQKASKKNPAGVVVEEGELLNNVKSGAWVTYWPEDGRIKTITNYIDGRKNGAFLELNNRGSVDLQCNYVNDVLDGKWVKYKFGSRAEKEVNYKMGEIDGLYREFHANGKMQKEIGFKAGKQHGRFRQFNDQEQVIMEYEYKNGEKISGGVVSPK